MSGDALGRALLRLEPPLRVLARHVLAAESPLDAVACDPHGGAVAVLRAAPGDDRSALVDLLAHVAWLEPRLADWRALAPSLPLAPETPVRGLLLASDFDVRTRRAAGAVSRLLRLGHWRAPPEGLGGDPWIELLEAVEPAPAPARGAPEPLPAADAAVSRFRTRLTASDLAPRVLPEGRESGGSEGSGDDSRHR